MPDFDKEKKEMKREIEMMVHQLDEWIDEYWYRKYNDTYGVVAQGVKCYGSALKVHSFLSGMQVIANANQSD